MLNKVLATLFVMTLLLKSRYLNDEMLYNDSAMSKNPLSSSSQSDNAKCCNVELLLITEAI